MVGLPAEEVLRIEPTTVDPVDGATPHTDDAAVLDGDVERVAVGVEDRRGLHPPLHVLRSDTGPEIPVHSYRPALTGSVRGARTPRLGDPVHDDRTNLFLVHQTSRMPPRAAPVADEAWRPTIERQLPVQWPHKSNQRGCRRGSSQSVATRAQHSPGRDLHERHVIGVGSIDRVAVRRRARPSAGRRPEAEHGDDDEWPQDEVPDGEPDHAPPRRSRPRAVASSGRAVLAGAGFVRSPATATREARPVVRCRSAPTGSPRHGPRTRRA